METHTARRGPRRGAWAWAALWLGILAAALWAGGWIRAERARRELRAGNAGARRVAALTRAARTAEVRGDAETALARAREALAALRATGGGGEPRARLLAELAALELRARPDDPASRAAARTHLREAWDTEGLPAPLRARLARDLGALAVLRGDLAAAEPWYRRSLEAAPRNPEVRRRLEALRRTREAEEPRGP